MAQYAELLGAPEPTEVPIANTGGSGTREGHWREVTFGNELMTGFVGAAGNPLSRLTIACLEDMGYEVNPSVAKIVGQIGVAMQPFSALRGNAAAPFPRLYLWTC